MIPEPATRAPNRDMLRLGVPEQARGIIIRSDDTPARLGLPQRLGMTLPFVTTSMIPAEGRGIKCVYRHPEVSR